MKKTLVYGLVVFSLSFGMTISAVASDVEYTKVLADKGYAEHQNKLGVMYAEGDGVERDFIKSFEWLQRAATQGYAPA